MRQKRMVFQIELGKEMEVHIPPFAKEGFSPEQISLLRRAVYDGMDIAPIRNKKLSTEQMEVMLWAMRHSVPVMEYVDSSFSPEQMEFLFFKQMQEETKYLHFYAKKERSPLQMINDSRAICALKLLGLSPSSYFNT